MPFDLDLVIVGGCGRVGLPLGLAFADRGLSVALYDVNERAVGQVTNGEMPFQEDGADEVLARVGDEPRRDDGPVRRGPRRARRSSSSARPSTSTSTRVRPRCPTPSKRWRRTCATGSCSILRSTLYPGVTAMVEQLIERLGVKVEVAFCPERIAEGAALEELFDLPADRRQPQRRPARRAPRSCSAR